MKVNRNKVKNRNELDSASKVEDKAVTKRISKRQQLKLPKEGVWIDGLQHIPYESFLELYFIQWALLLKREGFVKEVLRSGSYDLTDNVVSPYTDEKGKKKSQVLMRKSSYTPDVILTWEEGFEPFVWDGDSDTKKNRELVGRRDQDGVMTTVIEIKPIMDRNNSIRIATDRIKFLFSKNGVWVNMVQPDIFFEKTFPPPEYLLTSTGLKRKLKYEPRTLFDYLKMIAL